jgi:Ca2+-binding RTX toxin-like protein
MIHRIPSRIALRVAVPLAVAAGVLWAVASAGATHIAGATYNGTIQNAGPITFTVSGDGSGIISMSAAGPIPGDSCTFSNVSVSYVTPLPITNHAFNDSTPPLYFSGTFGQTQSATGQFRINQAGCDTGNLPWTATTTAAPPVTAPKCKGKTATIFPRPGLARTFNGTNGKDVIVGSSKKDTIRAKGGNDTVCAKGGRDTVKGGGGKDKLYGQGGKDKLIGGGGRDTCVGAGGNDTARCETERSI